MSIDRERGDFLFSHDLPHEHIMDQYQLELTDLNAALRTKIRLFDELFLKAMEDGYIDDTEEKELISESYKIAQIIQESYSDGSKGFEDVTAIGGLLLLIGTAIGLRQLIK